MTKLLKDLSVDFKDTDMPLRQVVVNTHSPVLVNQMIQWEDDKNVSIWLSQFNTLIADIEEKRIKLKITGMLPVIKKNTKQLTLTFSEQEEKLTLIELKKYLETADTENAINTITDMIHQ